MKKYKASEIIERALQLADLENSDFISDSEKIDLLNESFIQLFQKVVDSGDKTWSKSIVVTDSMELPADLYQIAAIYVTNGKEPINKINANQLTGYDVINNTLYLSDEYKGVSVTMDYVPVPPTIQLKEKKLNSPYPVKVLNACNNLYAYEDTEGHVIIADLNDKSANIDLYPATNVEVFKNGVISGDSDFYSFYDSDWLTIDVENYARLIVDGNLYRIGLDDKLIYDWNGNIMSETPLDLDLSNVAIVYADKELKNFYTMSNVDGAIVCRYMNNEFIRIGESSILNTLKGYVTEEGLYICSKFGSVYLVTPAEGLKIIPTENRGQFICSKKYVLTLGGFGGSQYLEGVRDDDLLSYPNQLFYILLSYMLAMQFKIKQGADTSGLSVEYQKAEMTFFDAISRDNNANYTMRNVYKTRRYF